MLRKKAIPTEYRGIQYKSRFEANVARFLTAIGWEYEYEPRAFMLDDGTTYIPDFLIRSYGGGVYGAAAIWVECRGYHSPNGDAQVTKFRQRAWEENWHYFVFGPERVLYTCGLVDAVLTYPEDGSWFRITSDQRGGVEQCVPITISKSDILVAGHDFTTALPVLRRGAQKKEAVSGANQPVRARTEP